MTREEEFSLLQRAQKDDMDAFETIVRAHEKTVYNLALRTLGSPEDAEDAAQEAFLKAYTSLKSFRGESKISVWLYRITNNVCIDFLRKRKDAVSLSVEDAEGAETELEIADETFDPAAIAERADLKARVGEAVQLLPPEQRDAFLLRVVAEQSYEEIAAVLGVDLGTVKSRIYRARRRLCVLLSENGNFSPGGASNNREGGVQA